MLSFSIAPAIAPHTLEFLGRQLIVERSSGSNACFTLQNSVIRYTVTLYPAIKPHS